MSAAFLCGFAASIRFDSHEIGHISLDAWQSKLKATTGRDFKMPILHLSQLVGAAAGLEESELRFKRHVVSVDPVLAKLEV